MPEGVYNTLQSDYKSKRKMHLIKFLIPVIVFSIIICFLFLYNDGNKIIFRKFFTTNGEEVFFKMNKYLVTLIALFFTAFFSFIIYKFSSKVNSYLKKEINEKKVIKEIVTISQSHTTPAGITIYWTDSENIQALEPSEISYEMGEQIQIYYTPYSKHILKIEKI